MQTFRDILVVLFLGGWVPIVLLIHNGREAYREKRLKEYFALIAIWIGSLAFVMGFGLMLEYCSYVLAVLLVIFVIFALIVSLANSIRNIREARHLGIPVSELTFYKLCQQNGWRYRNKVDRDADIEAALIHRRVADERCIHRNAAYKRRTAVRQRVKKKLRRLKL